MRRSIRWTLLGWYATILGIVIAGFGTALYLRQRSGALRRVDTELRAHALAVSNAIEWDEPEGFELEIRDEYRAFFERAGLDTPYFVIWGADRAVLAWSAAVPADVSYPGLDHAAPPSRREIVAEGPAGTRVLVGQEIAGLRREIAELAWTTLLVGAAALVAALVGGWFLVRRVLRPIDRISETASRISASNLSARIDVGRTESELGRLARTLNDAFDRLEEAVARQTRFTADASHELRTPLAVVATSAEWALRRARSPEEYADALETCRRATDRMGTIVEDLLELTRLDGEPRPLERTEVDLAEIVTETAALLEPLARTRGVTLELATEPTVLRGDRTRLGTVVVALLSNAILHGREGGQVEVQSEAGDGEGEVLLRVRDDGPGIPEADRARIFERFYRADPSRGRRTGGSGLGLAIALRIVEAHGGGIQARNPEAGGAEFTVRLPRGPEA